MRSIFNFLSLIGIVIYFVNEYKQKRLFTKNTENKTFNKFLLLYLIIVLFDIAAFSLFTLTAMACMGTCQPIDLIILRHNELLTILIGFPLLIIGLNFRKEIKTKARQHKK